MYWQKMHSPVWKSSGTVPCPSWSPKMNLTKKTRCFQVPSVKLTVGASFISPAVSWAVFISTVTWGEKREPSQLLRTELSSPKLSESKQVSQLDRPETVRNTGRFWWTVQSKKNPRTSQKVCSRFLQQPEWRCATERPSAALWCVNYLPPPPPAPPQRKDRRIWRKKSLPDESQLFSCWIEHRTLFNNVPPLICSIINLINSTLLLFLSGD